MTEKMISARLERPQMIDEIDKPRDNFREYVKNNNSATPSSVIIAKY